MTSSSMVAVDPASRQASPPAEPRQAVVDSIAGGALRVQGNDDAAICERLFKGLVFFLGREVPREQLLFVIRAFGGVVAWQGEGSPLQESDDSITHQVGPLLHVLTAVGVLLGCPLLSPCALCTWCIIHVTLRHQEFEVKLMHAGVFASTRPRRYI